MNTESLGTAEGGVISEAPSQLSPATVRVVREFVREGATNVALASALYISPATIRWHISTAMRVSGARTRTGLALWWIRAGQYAYPAEPEASHARAPSPRS